MKTFAALVAVLALVSCKSKSDDKAGDKPVVTAGPGSGSGSAAAGGSGTGSGTAAGPGKKRDEVERGEFNRLAARLNLPVFWIADTDGDKNLDDDEVVTDLMFYPPLAGTLDAAYAQIVELKQVPLPDAGMPDGKRRRLVADELDQGRVALVRNDLSRLDAGTKAFVAHMIEVGRQVDALYGVQTGEAALVGQLPPDPESKSLFRRNHGPKCVAPKTETEPACSALRGAPSPLVDVYPAAIGGTPQTDPSFCKKLAAAPNATELSTPFTVVREVGGKLAPVPFSEAYKEQMGGIAKELEAAAASLTDPAEAALVAYLRAAATGFTTNDWVPADEAWAKMNADNSKWYVRVGPDETYWEPCQLKAGFHLTFALINQGSKQWQDKLIPIQQEMEAAIAARAGAPYKAREVKFHLPDFIDIVVNAGDDRGAPGATIGQSLPNVGPVAKESRGRTIAMANLYTDPDSLDSRKAAASSLLDTAFMAIYVDDPTPGLLSTVLHEATHNLGPAQEYAVNGVPVSEKFGGQMDAMIEELKAQSGALFLVDLLKTKGVVSPELATQIYGDSIVWCLGQISNGMWTTVGHQRKTYPQLAAIQVGFMLDNGALSWDPAATAANGTDKGAFAFHLDKMPAVADAMMKLVAGIKGRGDTKAAEALSKKYVDGKVVPFAAIFERYRRLPRNSFVYSVTL